MILLVHITIALASVAFSTYAFFSPSTTKMRTNYALVAGTLASGTALVVTSHSNILHSCITGLVYVGAISCIIAATYRKLATSKVRSDK